MRRTLASLLLATLGIPPAAVSAWNSDAPSKVPACCRKNGAHRCETMLPPEELTGVAITAPLECASWPKSEVRSSNFAPAVAVAVFDAETPLSSGAVCNSVPFAFRNCAAGSTRKRGPPPLLD